MRRLFWTLFLCCMPARADVNAYVVVLETGIQTFTRRDTTGNDITTIRGTTHEGTHWVISTYGSTRSDRVCTAMALTEKPMVIGWNPADITTGSPPPPQKGVVWVRRLNYCLQPPSVQP